MMENSTAQQRHYQKRKSLGLSPIFVWLPDTAIAIIKAAAAADRRSTRNFIANLLEQWAKDNAPKE